MSKTTVKSVSVAKKQLEKAAEQLAAQQAHVQDIEQSLHNLERKDRAFQLAKATNQKTVKGDEVDASELIKLTFELKSAKNVLYDLQELQKTAQIAVQEAEKVEACDQYNKLAERRKHLNEDIQELFTEFIEKVIELDQVGYQQINLAPKFDLHVNANHPFFAHEGFFNWQIRKHKPVKRLIPIFGVQPANSRVESLNERDFFIIKQKV